MQFVPLVLFYTHDIPIRQIKVKMAVERNFQSARSRSLQLLANCNQRELHRIPDKALKSTGDACPGSSGTSCR